MVKNVTIAIKRSTPIHTVVTPQWKEGAEREISDAIAITNSQLADLEYEINEIMSEIHRQSLNILNSTLVQEQINSIQQQISLRRAELEEQKYNLLEQQRLIQSLELEDILEQGHLEGFCQLSIGDNLIEKLEVAILVRDGKIEAIENL
uniref:Uncharacterized protein n=1 Tax=Paulinella chromatophora TaxID=39717 RepID=B1X5B7_PAUCH|nr:hypothetical protein PCC_0721 [Paulinella chromatophora]ACB43136.1 hypothetical protein PCC_0721 [Paulinella chromatophora]|eukprot:gb/GEZN01016012.1/.p1 GENE.gb/GEZN01016012.1/~~gb/GEZN01016012.1/.p1  ORF type:complete len:149 (+),score=10.88 gb/GEZN01016012.1/:39-485(+)